MKKESLTELESLKKIKEHQPLSFKYYYPIEESIDYKKFDEISFYNSKSSFLNPFYKPISKIVKL